MEKCLKAMQKKKTKKKNEKEKMNPATQVKHHYVARRLLRLVDSEVTKHSKYTPYFTN